jgi:hypothetical protein
MPCRLASYLQKFAACGHRGLTGAFALVLLAAVLPAGCSEPPDKERQQAEGALEAARAAGADVYAPTEFQDAQASLKKYDDAVAQRDYRLALNEALEARDRAYDAVKQAGNKKSELRSQTDRLAQVLQGLIETAGLRLSAPAGRPVGPAADRLRAARDAGSKALQEARSRSEKQDYPGAVTALTPAVEALRRELPGSEPAATRRKK